MNAIIDHFDGKYLFLSNFYLSPVEFEGQIYPSNEHAYQAAKTLNLKARHVFSLPGMTPSMSKHLGKALTLRPGWDTLRLSVMWTLLENKFSNPILKENLICTGEAELIEGNTWNDTFWGVCNNKGSNLLGKFLMELRNEYAKTNLSAGE